MGTLYYRPMTTLTVDDSNVFKLQLSVSLDTGETLQKVDGDPTLVGGAYRLRYNVVQGNTPTFIDEQIIPWDQPGSINVVTSVAKGDIIRTASDSTDRAEPS